MAFAVVATIAARSLHARTGGTSLSYKSKDHHLFPFFLPSQRHSQQQQQQQRAKIVTMAMAIPEILYHIQYWSSSRVSQLIHELNLSPTTIKVEAITAETLKNDPTLTSKNPQKCVPFYEDPKTGFNMVESSAIMQYICEKHDKSHQLSPSPTETNRSKRGEWLQWLHYGPGTMYHLVVPIFMTTFEVDEAKQDKALIEKNIKEWKSKVVPLLTKALSDGRKYICGDKFSAADCSIGYDLMTASFTPVADQLIGKEGVIKEYFERLKERESWKALYTPQGTDDDNKV